MVQNVPLIVGLFGEGAVSEIETRRAQLEEKKAFLKEWTTKNPLATVAQVKDALRARFQETMNTGLINTALKEARDMVALRAQEGGSGSTGAPLTNGARSLGAIANELRNMGVIRMWLHPDGTFNVSFGTKK